jgi:hypothetical protein
MKLKIRAFILGGIGNYLSSARYPQEKRNQMGEFYFLFFNYNSQKG